MIRKSSPVERLPRSSASVPEAAFQGWTGRVIDLLARKRDPALRSLTERLASGYPGASTPLRRLASPALKLSSTSQRRRRWRLRNGSPQSS